MFNHGWRFDICHSTISSYIWNLGQTNPTVGNKKPFPSKYSEQLFDCGVPGKIQLLQIPETCEDELTEMKRGVLRETYVLSPRKLKKTSGVMCCVTVSKFRGYCGAYSHWKFQQTPVIEKSVPVTPEICNKAWREGIVTLLYSSSGGLAIFPSLQGFPCGAVL